MKSNLLFNATLHSYKKYNNILKIYYILIFEYIKYLTIIFLQVRRLQKRTNILS
jgi:hypothetical protein